MHRRTLNRRLRSENTTFRKVLDDVRFDVACQLLRNTDIPVAQIASSLAYGGDSAFGRAFRRRCVSSPTQWRKINQVSQPVADTFRRFRRG
jgi:AraC-like DNA-binding protein